MFLIFESGGHTYRMDARDGRTWRLTLTAWELITEPAEPVSA